MYNILSPYIQIRRVPPITITDMDFADDIALVSEGIKKAKENKIHELQYHSTV